MLHDAFHETKSAVYESLKERSKKAYSDCVILAVLTEVANTSRYIFDGRMISE